MKKLKIIFFTILLLIIVGVTAFIMLKKNEDNQEDNPSIDLSEQLTPSPTQIPTNLPTATPTDTPNQMTGLYPAYKTFDDKTSYGYINLSGEFVISPSFDMASNFYDDVAVVMIGESYRVIDKEGNVLFENENTINDYRNGAAVYLSKNKSGNYVYGYIDTKGDVLIHPQYIRATNFSKEGTAYVSTSIGSYQLIDKTGKILESYELNKYNSIWNLQDGYLIYVDDNTYQYGVATLEDKEVIKANYSEIRYLGEGLFAVKEPNLLSAEDIILAKNAIINQQGEQLTDYIYSDVSNFYEGYASATDGTSTFFIGTDGKEITTLSKFDGQGTLILLEDVVSAYIDDEQIYTDTSGTVLWKAEDTFALSDTLTVKKEILKPNPYVLVKYPQIDGLADKTIQDNINEELKSIFTDSRNRLTVDDMISVKDTFTAKLMNNLLIIRKDGYDYSFGAAHGMPIREYYYIDLKDGSFYLLKNLFKEDSDYASKINELITNEIEAQNASGEAYYFPDSFTGINEDYQAFKLEEDGIIIYFYPYEIAAYAAGFPEFPITFEVLSEYIDTNGDFYKSFR